MPIQSVSMDSTRLAVPDQFASWASHSDNTLLSPVRDGPFMARGTLWNLGSVYLTDVHLDPFTSFRDEPLVRASSADHVQLVALYEGSVRFEGGGIDQRCTAPDMFLRDYARPSRATATRIHAITVYFARDYLEDATGPLAGHGRIPLSPEAMVLGSTLRAIVDQLPRAEATSAGFYARTVRDLLAATVIRWLSRGTRHAALNADRLARAKAFMADQPPGTISVERLTGELGISRSVLFGLFRAHGGIMAYDRLRRLRSLYRDLSNPTDLRSIAELGARQGFLDKAELTRSFRRAFGCSLQEVRKRALSDGRGAEPRSAADDVRAAVERLT